MTMKLKNSLLAVTMMITSLRVTFPVKADTVNPRCDVYPKRKDSAISLVFVPFPKDKVP